MKYYAHRDDPKAFIRILPDGSIESCYVDGEWSNEGPIFVLTKMMRDTYWVELSKKDVIKRVLK
mgnify:CR=1 FL=1